MRQNKLNEHGQPFSKKQKKASRTMMRLRKGFTPSDSKGSQFKMAAHVDGTGIMAAVASLLFGMKLRRKAS